MKLGIFYRLSKISFKGIFNDIMLNIFQFCIKNFNSIIFLIFIMLKYNFFSIYIFRFIRLKRLLLNFGSLLGIALISNFRSKISLSLSKSACILKSVCITKIVFFNYLKKYFIYFLLFFLVLTFILILSLFFFFIYFHYESIYFFLYTFIQCDYRSYSKKFSSRNKKNDYNFDKDYRILDISIAENIRFPGLNSQINSMFTLVPLVYKIISNEYGYITIIISIRHTPLLNEGFWISIFYLVFNSLELDHFNLNIINVSVLANEFERAFGHNFTFFPTKENMLN